MCESGVIGRTSRLVGIFVNDNGIPVHPIANVAVVYGATLKKKPPTRSARDFRRQMVHMTAAKAAGKAAVLQDGQCDSGIIAT